MLSREEMKALAEQTIGREILWCKAGEETLRAPTGPPGDLGKSHVPIQFLIYETFVEVDGKRHFNSRLATFISDRRASDVIVADWQEPA